MDTSIMDTLTVGSVIHINTLTGLTVMGILKKLDKRKMLLYIEWEDNNGHKKYVINFRNCTCCWQTVKEG